MIQQRRTTRGGADQKDLDLAVVLFAQTAIVLPGHTDALIAFLGKTTLVDGAYDSNLAVGYGWHQFIDENALNLGVYTLVVPGRNVDELLHSSRAIGSTLLRSGQIISPLM